MTVPPDDIDGSQSGEACGPQSAATKDGSSQNEQTDLSQKILKPEMARATPNVWVKRRQKAKDMLGRIRSSRAMRFVKRSLGELTAILLGLTFVWLWLLNQVLANDETDISFLKPNISLLFAQAFEGRSGDIGSVKLYWAPLRNQVGIGLKDVSIFDGDDEEIQYVDSLSAWFDVTDLLALSVKAQEINIVGGEITWLRSKDGGGILGLGTPDTVGRFGVIYSTKGRRLAPNWGDGADDTRLVGLRLAAIEQAKIHIRDEISDFSAVLAPANLTLARSGGGMELDLELIPKLAASEGPSHSDSIVKLHAKFLQDENIGSGEITALKIYPHNYAPHKGRFEALSGFQLPVNLQGDFTFDRRSIIQANMILDMGKGKIVLDHLQNKVGKAHLDINYSGVDAPIIINAFNLASEKFTGQGKGQVKWVKPQGLRDNTSFDYSALIDNFNVDLSPFIASPLDAKQLQVTGNWTPKRRAMDISSLTYSQQDYKLMGDMAFALSDMGKLSSFSGNLQNKGSLPIDDFLGLWPQSLAPVTRQWLDTAFQAGWLTSFSGKFDLTPELFQQDWISPEALSIDMAISDAEIYFMSDMPHIFGAQGTGRINGSEMTFLTEAGQFNNLRLSNGRVYFPNFRAPDSRLMIEALASGQLLDMLEIADREPIALTRRFGMPVAPTRGHGVVSLSLQRPLGRPLQVNELRYDLSGDFSDVASPLPGKHFNLALTDGRGKMQVNNNGISVTGPAKLNGWDANLSAEKSFTMIDLPTHYTLKGRFGRDIIDSLGIGLRQYIGGFMDISVDMFGSGVGIDDAHIIADLTDAELSLGDFYNKLPGQAALLSFSYHMEADKLLRAENMNFTAPNLSLKGGLALQKNMQFEHLNLEHIKMTDLIDGALKIRPNQAHDRFIVAFDGPSFNLASILQNRQDNQTKPANIPAEFNAQIDRLILADTYEVSQAKIDARFGQSGFEYGAIQGERPEGPFSLKVSMPIADKPRPVLAKVPDVAALARSLLQQTSFEGGKFSLSAELPPIGKSGALTGQMEMQDFTLTKAPALAQMLSMASLKGITDTFAGSGLYFEILDVPFSYERGALEFRDARMNGPALGMTGNGNIDFGLKMMDVDGVLVPSYTANSLFGDIPVLGEVLVGKKGEGVFALNYTVKGPFETTQVNINPLSALTPGFLRRIFDAPRSQLKKLRKPSEKE